MSIDFLCLRRPRSPALPAGRLGEVGGFSGEDNYKQFADIRKTELPQTIIIGLKSDKTREAQISLKLNTSGGQKNGSYSNTITFIAIPGY